MHLQVAAAATRSIEHMYTGQHGERHYTDQTYA